MAPLEQKAVLDRVEGSLAFLLVGEEERRLHIPLHRLPPGVKEGDWLKLTLSNGEIISIQPDPEETSKRRRLIEAKLELLRQKKKQ